METNQIQAAGEYLNQMFLAGVQPRDSVNLLEERYPDFRLYLVEISEAAEKDADLKGIDYLADDPG
jgi:hypothetical protein